MTARTCACTTCNWPFFIECKISVEIYDLLVSDKWNERISTESETPKLYVYSFVQFTIYQRVPLLRTLILWPNVNTECAQYASSNMVDEWCLCCYCYCYILQCTYMVARIFSIFITIPTSYAWITSLFLAGIESAYACIWLIPLSVFALQLLRVAICAATAFLSVCVDDSTIQAILPKPVM